MKYITKLGYKYVFFAFILVAILTTCFTEKKITSSLIPFFRNTVPNTEFFPHPETNILECCIASDSSFHCFSQF